jgi:hypothetical protein
MHIDRRLLGWGAFFILLGAIPLAVQQGWLQGELIARWWSLWPLLLIGWGLGLVLRETPVEWLGGAVTAVTFGVMGGSLIATGFGGVPFSVGCTGSDTSAFVAPTGTLASNSSVSITLPCGQLSVVGVDGGEWSVSGTAGQNGQPVIETAADRLVIKGKEGAGFMTDDRRTWNVELPRDAANTALSVTLNAGEGTVALDGLQLTAASVTLNAGKLSVAGANAASLGGVSGTVNAGALSVSLQASGTGSFTVNAGSLNVCLPEGADVQVLAHSTLGSNNLEDLGLRSVGEDTWETAGYASAQQRVELSVTTNAGSFELAIGGGCGA